MGRIRGETRLTIKAGERPYRELLASETGDLPGLGEGDPRAEGGDVLGMKNGAGGKNRYPYRH